MAYSCRKGYRNRRSHLVNLSWQLKLQPMLKKKGMQVVYFDAESAIDLTFSTRAGVDIGELLYVQAVSVEDSQTDRDPNDKLSRHSVFVYLGLNRCYSL